MSIEKQELHLLRIQQLQKAEELKVEQLKKQQELGINYIFNSPL